MPPHTRSERYFDEAMDALRGQRYNLAFDLFTEVMELEPEVHEVHYNRGLAAGHLLKWEEAERNFTMALRMAVDPAYHLHRAIARMHQRRWQEAIEDLDAALALDRELELASLHRNGLELFLRTAGRGPADVPMHVREWFDPRLDAFVGVDPEIVPKADRESLRRSIAEDLRDSDPPGCDHTHRFTEEWALRNRRDPLGVARFLFERGLTCDCRVLAEGQSGERLGLPESGNSDGGAVKPA